MKIACLRRVMILGEGRQAVGLHVDRSWDLRRDNDGRMTEV